MRTPKLHTVWVVFLAAWCLIVASACVTSGDLREVASKVEDFERVAADRYATEEEVRDAATELRQGIEAVAVAVEDRTRGFIDGVGQGAEGGLVGIIAALGLNAYRNHTRKRDVPKLARDNQPGA